MTKRFRLHIKTLQSFQSGPLGTHLESFASLLIRRGYSSEAGWDKIRLVADLSRWMVHKKARLEELDEKRTATFLGWHWKRVARQTGDQCTLAMLLRQLRQERIIPAPTAPAPSHIDLIEHDYERFLQQERGLMSNTIEGYLRVARRFLSQRLEKDEIRLKELCTKDVTDFVVQDASTRGPRAAQLNLQLTATAWEIDSVSQALLALWRDKNAGLSPSRETLTTTILENGTFDGLDFPNANLRLSFLYHSSFKASRV
jgi:hypothetical protein